MSPDHQEPEQTGVVPLGVQSLKDYSTNIFAFAATLLVVDIMVPPIPQSQVDWQLPAALFQNWRYFLIYITSFLNISNYWTAHAYIFENIIRTDRTLIRLNILLLLSVTFLPYPSVLMGQYGRHAVVALIYGIAITTTYFLLTCITGYAYSHNRLVSHQLHLPLKKILRIKAMGPLLLAITGTALSFFFPRLSFLFYFLVSASFMLPVERFIRGSRPMPSP